MRQPMQLMRRMLQIMRQITTIIQMMTGMMGMMGMMEMQTALEAPQDQEMMAATMALAMAVDHKAMIEINNFAND
jgi:hypothetical protein